MSEINNNDNNNNKEKKIYDAITNVSDELVDEAAKTKRKKFYRFAKRSPKLWSAIAAIAACAVIVPVIVMQMTKPQEILPPVDEPAQTTEQSRMDSTVNDEEVKNLLRELGEDYLLSSVTPLKMTGRVIETDTAFSLETAAEIDALALENLIAVEPDIPFEITQSEACAYSLRFLEPLEAGSIMKMSLLNEYGEESKSWAFQTNDTFRVTSTLPSDEGRYVPVETGIEITFSQTTDITELEKYFEITPQVSGHFEKFRSTLVFVPDEKLSYNTVYTVTIKEGLVSAEGNALEEAKTFKFKTSYPDVYLYCSIANGVSETFLPGDMAVVEFYRSEALFQNEFEINLYQYENSKMYLDALNDYAQGKSWEEEYIFPTDSLPLVYSANEKAINHPDAREWNNNFIMLPENLEEGYYIADIITIYNNIEYRMQKLIQINPISVYSSVLPGQAAFFVNDTVTGSAAENAAVSLDINGNTEQTSVGSEGTALLRINSDEYGTGTLRIEYNGSVYIDLFDYSAPGSYNPLKDYYLYIYTDREIYLSTDTVNVWGVILPRTKDAVMPPPDLNLMLGYDKNESEAVPFELKNDGTFTASISYQNHTEQWWLPVKLMSGDSQLCEKSVIIKDYVKPNYIIETETPLFAWLPQNNPVDVNLYASYFDGTPAKGLGFRISSSQPNINITTDENGEASTQIMGKKPNLNGTDVQEAVAIEVSGHTWRPVSDAVVFEMTGIENEYQTAYDSFYSLYRDTMLEYETSGNSVTVKTSHIVTDRIKVESDLSWGKYADTLRGEPVDTAVTAVLKRSWSEKIPKGSYYDFIQKKNVENYEYRYRDEVVGTYEIVTKDGIGVFENLPMDDKESTYWIELGCYDTADRFIAEWVYFYNSNYYQRDGYHYYSLENKNQTRTFTENQTIEFQLADRSVEVENEGRIFYAFSGYDFITLGTEGKNSFVHTMTDSYIPNVILSGAYFDGRHVYPLTASEYFFNPKERNITFNIATDKEKYAPADDVNMTVTAADINGSPIKNASVSFSLVDEAIFAIAEQNATPLETIYRSIYFPQVNVYHSYIQHVLNFYSGGEKGGGGGAPDVRRDFKDIAAFLTGTTDENGEVSFSFKLPDNMTTWRATIQAVGEDSTGRLYMGTTRTPVVASLPFFLIPVVLPQYIEGDDFSVTAKVVGETEEALLTARLTGNGVDETLSGKPGESFMFGKLEKGEYKILFTAADGENSDAVELPVEVVDTMLESYVTREFNLSEGFPDILPTRYPVTVVFSDNEYKLYGKVLNSLYSSYGNRMDFRIANAFSQLELGYISREDYVKMLAELSQNSVARLLPYSETDYTLTSLICAAAPDLLNANLTADALFQKLNERIISSETATSCLMGLAALSKPVLTDIYDLLENPEGLSYQDKLRLCNALALLGDSTGALKYYTGLTEENLVYYIDPKTDEKTAYLRGNNSEESISDTALALLTASVLNLQEADGMARYLIDNKSKEQTVVLELMTYLRNYTPKKPGDAAFTYNLNGKTEMVKLERFYGMTMRFGKEQLENADFKIISGDVNCNVYYIGGLEEQQKQPSLTLTKEITQAEGDRSVGGLLKVKISIPSNSESGYYLIEDVIPSGARYVSASSDFYIERSGQRIKAGLSYDPKYPQNNYIMYYIRLSTAGEYVVENAVIHDEENNWGKTERGVMNIES